MASLRSYAYGLGLLLLIVGLILIPFSGNQVTQQSAILMFLGGALIVGAYLFAWIKRHPLATAVIVAILLILLYVFLPVLSPSPPRFAPTAPTTAEFPAASDAAGTNCEASDLGSWFSREQAFEDSEPNTNSTSARAEGTPIGAACDDWTGFGFELDDTLAVTRVLVTFEYAIQEGTVQLRIAPFTSRGPTECVDQSTTIQSGPTAYQVETFDFTGCKAWTAQDFNNNAFGVTIEAVPEIQSTLLLDYVKVTVEQEGQAAAAGAPSLTVTAETRALAALALGIVALVAALTAAILWLFRLRRASPKLFRWSVLVAIFAGLGWFLLSYVVV